MRLAEPGESRFGGGLFAGDEKAVPDIEQGHEIRLFIDKLPVHLIGLEFLVRRPHSRILDGEGGGKDADLLACAKGHAFNDDPGNTRVKGQPGHQPSLGRELLIADQGTELFQCAVAIADRG